MKTILIITALFLSGCGAIDRLTSSFTGGGTETCVSGVTYLQFTSGVTVKYAPDGKVVGCK